MKVQETRVNKKEWVKLAENCSSEGLQQLAKAFVDDTRNV